MAIKTADIWELVERFRFTKPVTVQHGEDPEAFMTEDEVLVMVPRDAELDDACEVVARARMAQDCPVLGMYFFHDEMSAQGKWAMRHFVTMTFPLQSAWTMRFKRRYAPEIYRVEVEQVLDVWRTVNDEQLIEEKRDYESMAQAFAILAEGSFIDRSSVDVDPAYSRYYDTLARLVHADPDPELYIELVNSLPVNYTVSIDYEDNVYRVSMNNAGCGRSS